MIIDSHAHYSLTSFDNTFSCVQYENAAFSKLTEQTREKLMEKLKKAGIRCVIEPAIELENGSFGSNDAVLRFSRRHPDFVFPAVGLHPTRAAKTPFGNKTKLKAFAEDESIVAIGEAGLDLHQGRGYTKVDWHPLRQLRWFVYQIRLADAKKLPLILHIRCDIPCGDVPAQLVLRLNRRRLHGGVVHCFCGDEKTAERYLKLGLQLGIGGALLQDNATGERLRKTVAAVPLERILTETDAPYVLPVNLKNARNSSLILPAVIEKIAELKQVSPEEVERQTAENAIALFRLPFGD